MSAPPPRRFAIGAEVQPSGGTHFRVWAPSPRETRLVIDRDGGLSDIDLEAEGDGYSSAFVSDVKAGARYWYRLDGDLVADPASRFQPDGPFGPSMIVDPATYVWSADAPNVVREGQVLYEMHIGTFTSEGTWRSAAGRLGSLARIGITVVEVMPVAEFPGGFGWGYDGVFPWAPTRLYGSPDEFRAFVDRAHGHGLAVILDVVYNHLGPDGCVFSRYAPSYFAKRNATEWGEGLNFDGRCSAPVREYFIANAAYWIEEFRLDGLRLDATQSIHDRSARHVLQEITASARAAAGRRSILIVAENEPQRVELLGAPESGGQGVDMLWNDDFHHSAIVALTGRREAYYTDYTGRPQEFVSSAKRGFLFQGQRYEWQQQRRGSRTDGIPPAAFVNYLENHDQIANSGDGSRLHARTSPGRYRAMTALLLLLPGTPVLFQGQEFGASAPFLYFADHRPQIAGAVQKGRGEFVSQFRGLASPEMQERLPIPHDPETFERCRLDWREFDSHQSHRRLHEDLLAMRKSDAAFHQRAGGVDGAVIGAEAFVLRFAGTRAEDERLLIVNLGADLREASIAEPLMAPPTGHTWELRWSSENPDYGGIGTGAMNESEWSIPGHAAIVLRPVASDAAEGGREEG